MMMRLDSNTMGINAADAEPQYFEEGLDRLFFDASIRYFSASASSRWRLF